VIISLGKGIEYDTTEIESCEYIQAMAKTYSKPPKIENGKCAGFRNKYDNKLISLVCGKCPNMGNNQNDID
jgi:hypothetical protein